MMKADQFLILNLLFESVFNVFWNRGKKLSSKIALLLKVIHKVHRVVYKNM